MFHQLTLALGSNLGDRAVYLLRARSLVEANLGPVTYASEVIETPAWGVTDQPDFLNQVLVVDISEWSAAPLPHPAAPASAPPIAAMLHRLLDACQAIEKELDRVRKSDWGPRTVDLDLIFVDEVRWEDARLSLPHPWWEERAFVRELLP